MNRRTTPAPNHDVERLQRHLAREAASADLGQTPVRLIMTRGKRRRARRRTKLMAGTLAVCTLASVSGVYALSRDNGGTKLVSTPDNDNNGPIIADGGADTTAPGAAALVESPLVWNTVDVDSSETLSWLGRADDMGAESATAPFYAISTEPGRSSSGNAGPVLYQSNDGIHWRVADSQNNSAPGGVSPGMATPVGDRLYAVSTQTATARVANSGPYDVVASYSDDGGATWQSQALPYDLGPIASEAGIANVNISRSGIAAVGNTVLVSAVIRAAVTVESAASILGVQRYGLEPTAGGFIERETSPMDCAELDQLMLQASQEYEAKLAAGESVPPSSAQPGTYWYEGDKHACYRWGAQIARHSWEQLGFSAEAQAAMDGLPMLFSSTGGGPFVEVGSPPVPRDAQIEQLRVYEDGDGFLAVAGGWNGIYAFRSADLATWTALPPLEGSYATAQMGLAAGRLTVVSYDQRSAPSVHVLAEGTWRTTALSDLASGDLAAGFGQVAVGGRGVAMIGQVGDLNPAFAEAQEAAATATTVSGVPATTPASDAATATMPEGTFPPYFQPGSEDWMVLYSPDGLTWSREMLSDLVDIGAGRITGVRVTDTNVLVTVREPTDLTDPNAPLPDATVLVGTLAG